MTIPLGCELPHTSRDRPGRLAEKAYVPSLFGLAPGGACRAAPVARNAVRSYRTISTLPRPIFRKKSGPVGGVISVALSLGSPPPDVIRHRFSVEPGLSSNLLRDPRSPGHLTGGLYAGLCQPSSPQAGAFIVPFTIQLCGPEMALEGGDHFALRGVRVIAVTRQGIGAQIACTP